MMTSTLMRDSYAGTVRSARLGTQMDRTLVPSAMRGNRQSRRDTSQMRHLTPRPCRSRTRRQRRLRVCRRARRKNRSAATGRRFRPLHKVVLYRSRSRGTTRLCRLARGPRAALEAAAVVAIVDSRPGSHSEPERCGWASIRARCTECTAQCVPETIRSRR
mgnify:CR=1 FL=1